MMVYTISEMKIVMEEYREMQIFVREANSEDLQNVIDGLLSDLFYLYFKMKEDQKQLLIAQHNLNNETAI